MTQYQVTLNAQTLQHLFSSDSQLAQLLESILNQVLEAQVSEQLHAERYERTEERQGYRNGFKPRQLTTRVGTLALQRVNGTLQLVEPKSASSRRTVALPQVVLEALRAHRTRQREDQLLAGARWQERRLVFTTREGQPLDARNVFRGFQRLLARAGLPHPRLHDLRHACATLLIAQGVHPCVMMEILGHSQISLTMNTYGHVTPALQQEAAGRMDVALRATTKMGVLAIDDTTSSAWCDQG